MENKKEELKVLVPFPVLAIDEQGKVIASNDRIGEVFLYDQVKGVDIFTITAITGEDLRESVNTGKTFEIERSDKRFRLKVYEDKYFGKKAYFILFQDITSYAEIKEKYASEKPCAMRIEIDNYDELIYPSGEDPRLELSSEIDKAIRIWLSKFDATVNRLQGGAYNVWFEYRYLNQMKEEKFSILDEIRELDTQGEFPASLSIGVGALGKNMAETESFSSDAIELALGRGGDQVVIKKSSKIEYIGGNLQALAKGNKGKSRIFGLALKQLILQSNKVIIQGHKGTDMDSFGSSLGIYRLTLECNKEPYIVVDEVSDSLSAIYKEAIENEYNIINSTKALELVDSDTLLVIVDTHRKSLVQAPKLLEKTDKVVVIDHHRRTEDMIENPTLFYMETYASSASELVTEILQFMIGKKKLEKIEAEGLLAGIMVDTDRYVMKTGVRTFEASAWLRRNGADPTEVNRYFQEDFDLVKVKSLALLKAEIYKEKAIAITTLDYISPDAQVLCAQLADELLTLKGVKASFVVGRNLKETVISARSFGGTNVQTIMEKFGGGGHLSVAAAQVEEGIEETKWKIMEVLDIKGEE